VLQAAAEVLQKALNTLHMKAEVGGVQQHWGSSWEEDAQEVALAF
jgi:hypothetical protein